MEEKGGTEKEAGRREEWNRESGRARRGKVVVKAREARTEEEKGGKVEAKGMDTKEHALNADKWGIRR